MLKYKNYLSIVEYDSDGKIFTGEVLDLRDVITFPGRTPDELERSFRQSMDFYLEMRSAARDKVSSEESFSEKSPFDVRSVQLPITKTDILESIRKSRASGESLRLTFRNPPASDTIPSARRTLRFTQEKPSALPVGGFLCVSLMVSGHRV
jgi:predicted HicB family RNase H-like nuclease